MIEAYCPVHDGYHTDGDGFCGVYENASDEFRSEMDDCERLDKDGVRRRIEAKEGELGRLREFDPPEGASVDDVIEGLEQEIERLKEVYDEVEEGEGE